MKVTLPNEIASRYDIGSIIYKKDYEAKLVYTIKVNKIYYHGYKNKDTHVKFGGKVIRIKQLK